MRRSHVAVLAASLAALAATAAADPTVSQIPVLVGSRDVVIGSVDPIQTSEGGEDGVPPPTFGPDYDTFSVFLGKDDTLAVTCRETGPNFGLHIALSLFGPTGQDTGVSVTGQGTRLASFTYDPSVTGTYTLQVTGDPGGFAGSSGNFALSVVVTRPRVPAATFADAAGGAISVKFTAPAGSVVKLGASTRRGGFDLTALKQPDGTPDPTFTSHVIARTRRAAVVRRHVVSASGEFELNGNYEAGSSVVVRITVITGEKRRTRLMTRDEPMFRLGTVFYPVVAIVGSPVDVDSQNFDYVHFTPRPGRPARPDIVPQFFVGTVPVPS